MIFKKQPAHWVRALTAQECQLLRPIFRNSIRYESVRVVCGQFLPLQAAYMAMSPNGSIYLPSALFCDDFANAHTVQKNLFVHECVHVWQYGLGYPVLRCGVCLALQGGYFRQRTYRYQDYLATHTHLSQFNMEQQASMIADYFTLGDEFAEQRKSITPILQAFLQQPNNSALLPTHMRCT